MKIQKIFFIVMVIVGMTSCSVSNSDYCAGSREQDSIVRARTSTLLSQMHFEFRGVPMKLHPTNPVTLIISSPDISQGRKIADRWDDLIRHNLVNAGPCSVGVIGEDQ